MTLYDQIFFGVVGVLAFFGFLYFAFKIGRERECLVRMDEAMQIITQNTVDSIRIDNERLKCYMIVRLPSGIKYAISEETYYLNPDVIYLPNGTMINKHTIESMRRYYLGTGIMYSQTHSDVNLMNFPVFLVGDSETDIKKVYTELFVCEPHSSDRRFMGIVDGNKISWDEDIFDSFWDVKNIVRNEDEILSRRLL